MEQIILTYIDFHNKQLKNLTRLAVTDPNFFVSFPYKISVIDETEFSFQAVFEIVTKIESRADTLPDK